MARAVLVVADQVVADQEAAGPTCRLDHLAVAVVAAASERAGE